MVSTLCFSSPSISSLSYCSFPFLFLSSVVNSNDNDLIDLKNLNIFADILDGEDDFFKRSYRSSCSKFWNGGHNVENYNDNDVSILLFSLSLVATC